MSNDLSNAIALIRILEAAATALENYGIGQREFVELREQAFDQGLDEIPDVMINAKLSDAQSAIDTIGADA